MKKHIPQKISAPSIRNNLVKPLNNTNPKQSVDGETVWSDKNPYFKGFLPEIWNFCNVSEQICNNWLKTRNDSLLSNEDSQRYQRLIIVLKEIVQLVEDIKIRIQRHQSKKLKVFEKVRIIVAEKLEIELVQVTPIANLVCDLGADSLEKIELVMALEEAFHIEIPHPVAEAFSTVQQMSNYISQKVEFNLEIGLEK
jgi:acyl carrier protein